MTKTTILPNDLIWGAQSIARYINRPLRTTYYLIEKGLIPAKKLGPRTIVARASELDHALSRDDAKIACLDEGVSLSPKLGAARHQPAKKTKGA